MCHTYIFGRAFLFLGESWKKHQFPQNIEQLNGFPHSQKKFLDTEDWSNGYWISASISQQ